MIIKALFDFRERIFFYLNYLIIIFALLMPIKPYLGKKVFLIIFILWILSLNYKDIYNLFSENIAFKSIFMYSLFLTFSLLWTENISNGLKWLEVYYIYFFIPLIVFSTVVKKEFIGYLISVFLLSMMINECISYGIFFGLIDNIFGFYVHGDSYNPLPYQSSHITYSSYVAFAIFLAIYKLFHKGELALKVLSVFFVITMTANLFLSAGRTGQVFFILTVFSLMFIYFRRYIKGLFITACCLILTLWLAYNISNTFKDRVEFARSDILKVAENGNYNSSWGFRILNYIIFPELMVENNFLFGTGVGDINDVVHSKLKVYFDENSAFSVNKGLMHNTFMEILVSIGVIGFSLFCFFLYYMAKLKIRNDEIKYLRYVTFGFIVFSGISTSMFILKEFMYLASFFLSIIFIGSDDEKN